MSSRDINGELIASTLPLVSIVCITYNHEKYIRQCLEGFVMQKTDFRFEIVIHDDASTDKTAEIIREYCGKYPDLFKPILQSKNRYSEKKGILVPYVYPQCKGKYIALCEGDDYWTDPLKLQKQVDFLEANSDYCMCYTRVRSYHQEMGRFKAVWGGAETNDFESILKYNPVPTLTVVVRKDYVLRYSHEIRPEEKGWLMGDYPLWLWLAHESKIKFLPDITGVYRVLQNSASHSGNLEHRERFIYSIFAMKSFFADKFNSNNRAVIQSQLAASLLSNAAYHDARDKAIEYFRKIEKPTWKLYLKYLICKYPFTYKIAQRIYWKK